MGILNRGIEKWAKTNHAQQLAEFIVQLQSMNGPEIGLGFAVATHWRNSLPLTRELMDPLYYVSANPLVGLEFERMVRKMYRNGRDLDVLGLQVWLHTLRAAMSMELRELAKDMWRELERGFPFAHESAISYHRNTGVALKFEYTALYPEGFTPEPVQTLNPRGAMSQATAATGTRFTACC